MPLNNKIKDIILIILLILCLLVSMIKPHDYLTWFLEVAPILIAIPIMIFNIKKSFISKGLLYIIFFHCIILMIGGHYTYSLVPFVDFLSFGSTRNNFDKVGHFMQGFTACIIVYEILLKKFHIRREIIVLILGIFVSLGFSALYEIIEFTTSVLLGEDAESFIGSQGDPWDSQKDMIFALIGSICASIFWSVRIAKIQPNELS